MFLLSGLLVGLSLVTAVMKDQRGTSWLTNPISFVVSRLPLKILGTEVVVQDYYRLCGHTLPGTLPPGLTLSHFSYTELLQTYTLLQGWQVTAPVHGRLVLTRQKDELCPEDQKQRHLGLVGDYVAVYFGPPGSAGKVERVTEIKAGILPLGLGEKIQRGQFGFADEASLLQALDSLEEYR
jgi:hypothetical protein